MFNEDLCSSSTANLWAEELLGTIVHEFIHAEIYNDLYSQGFISGNEDEFSEIWEAWVQQNYPNSVPPTPNQHQVMAQHYIGAITASLHALNDNIGSPSDYEIFAWQGLVSAFEDDPALEAAIVPTEEELDAMEDLFMLNVATNEDRPYADCN